VGEERERGNPPVTNGAILKLAPLPQRNITGNRGFGSKPVIFFWLRVRGWRGLVCDELAPFRHLKFKQAQRPKRGSLGPKESHPRAVPQPQGQKWPTSNAICGSRFMFLPF
jgi:hypothetical protein